MENNTQPIIKDLVLVGGGHSHLFVLMHFGMNPVPGLRLTLITRDLHTPYSGMLPGYIAGHYRYDEAHIDLRRLAQFAGARIFHAEVEALNLEKKQVHCPDRPPVSYDVLSINIGSRPGTVHVPGAQQYAYPVKPIDHFLDQWGKLVTSVLEAKGNYKIAVVGGGAGGVEMALATQYRLRKELQLAGAASTALVHHLLTDQNEILSSHNARVRARFSRVLTERDIQVHLNHQVDELTDGQLHCSNGKHIDADAVLWLTNAAAPQWPKAAGLDVDTKGFIAVNDTLESTSHPGVFAAGDIAAVLKYPRPKSGVFAVRQGMPLANNLACSIRGQRLKPFKPQSNFLGLISTGDRHAVASRSNWSLEGDWIWTVKDWIDRRFMDKFSELPEMDEQNNAGVDTSLAGESAIKEISAMAMRCGGCGAKVGSTVLSRVINRLSPISRDDIVIGLSDPDDAAVSEVPPGKLIVQSVDYFRSFIDDAYVFGQIAANHALSDIFAMGAETQSAMAIATIPYGLENQVEDQLFQTMSGALDVLNASNTALVGGHSSEGAELSFGLSVTGLIDRAKVLRKTGMQAGDILLVTKPLGTGTLFAADMRYKAKGRWIDAAIQHMLLSNQSAGLCMHRHGVSACTDVTGFGLLGHLVEMTRSSGMDVEIHLDALPIMDGALETIEMGIFSSLQDQNVRLRRAIRDPGSLRQHKHYPMLFDPQTSGGLLASVPANRLEACMAELKQLNYTSTVVIGRVLADSNDIESVRLA